AVRADCTSADRPGGALEAGALCPAGRIPDFQGVVVTCGDDEGAVRADRTSADRPTLAPERGALFPAGRIPDLQRLVVTGRDDEGAIRADRTSVDPVGVGHQGSDKGSGFAEGRPRPQPRSCSRTAPVR